MDEQRSVGKGWGIPGREPMAVADVVSPNSPAMVTVSVAESTAVSSSSATGSRLVL